MSTRNLFLAFIISALGYSISLQAKESKEEEDQPWAAPPVVQITKSETDVKVVVEPNVFMDRKKISEMKSVRIATDKGEFLGHKAFAANDEKRRAEFNIDPTAMEITNLVVIVNSAVDGDWIKNIPFEEVNPEGEMLYTSQAKAEEEGLRIEETPAETAEKTEAPKKKGWWFW